MDKATGRCSDMMSAAGDGAKPAFHFDAEVLGHARQGQLAGLNGRMGEWAAEPQDLVGAVGAHAVIIRSARISRFRRSQSR